MLDKLLDYLNVREEERTQVLLMLGAGFFMGTFLAVYSVVAESLFLSTLGSQLNQAFLYSGAFGIAATALFSYGQNHIRFSVLTTASMTLLVLLTLFFYVGYHFGPDEYKSPIIFTMFCMIGPITTVSLLSYWGVFGRLFNFRQSKRIIGWIDTGSLTAVIIANLMIPITSKIFIDTDNYLIVCVLSIILAASFYITISLRFPLSKNNPREFDKSVRQEADILQVIKDPYTKLLSIFLIISMVLLILGQYTFQELIKVQYPDTNSLASFLAFFNAAVYGLSFIMQTFVNDRITGNYGIKVALMLLPTIVGVFAIVASINGLFFDVNPKVSPLAAQFFFLFIALTRLFNNMIRDSLENPMFKLLFIPLDSRSRFGIQSKVEGVVNETGRFTAGALIFVFGMLTFFKLVWMPVILMVLTGLYFIVVNKLYSGYKAKIKAKLEAAQSSAESLEFGEERFTKKLEQRLLGNSPGTAVFSYKLLEKINPKEAAKWVNQLIRHDQPEVHAFAQQKINEMKGLSISDRYVIRYDSSKAKVADKNLLTRAELETLFKSGGDITKTRLTKLARSHDPGDRQYAAELLLHTLSEESISYLIELLGDNDPVVRQTAIKTAIKKNTPEVIRALIENLSNPLSGGQAANALVIIGGKALNILDTAFYRTGQTPQALNLIVQIIGRIGGQHARDILWSKIDYPDKVVVSKVLLALGQAGFKASESQGPRIRFAIENDISDISWNYNAIAELGNEEVSKDVREALRSEIANDVEHVYMLLGMLYDTRSIQLVKENIDSGTVEGIAFAVELLDVFLSDQLKQRVIPCLDELSDQERIRRLEQFYPRVSLDEKLVLKFALNREFTQANRWTKSCIIRQIGVEKIMEFQMDLVAQLFNPDPLIREMAAWSLYQINPDEYESNMMRFGIDAKHQMDALIFPDHRSARRTLFDKIQFYRSVEVFEGISGLAMSFLADWSTESVLAPGQSLVIDEKGNTQFYIVYSGEVEYYQQGELKGTYTKGQFIGEMLTHPGFLNSNILVSREGASLMRLSKDQLYELMSDNVKLADRILEYV